MATAGDAPALGTIADAAGLFPADMLAGMIAPYLSGEAEDLWWTVEHEGVLAGFAFCEPERFTNGTWNMRAIAVDPRHQSRGLGAALVREIESALARMGGRLIVVETDSEPEHARTCAFYAANDYREEARLQDFWDDGVHKVVFRKKL